MCSVEQQTGRHRHKLHCQGGNNSLLKKGVVSGLSSRSRAANDEKTSKANVMSEPQLR